MFITSIDIGVKNLAIYTEIFDKNWVCSKETPDEVCSIGRCVFLARLDLYQEGKCGCRIPDVVYERLKEFFELHSDILKLSRCVIIEEQLYAFNKIAPQMAAMIKMYLMTVYPMMSVIFVSLGWDILC